MQATETSSKTGRREIPFGSVWKYYNPYYPNGEEVFGTINVEAFVEVHESAHGRPYYNVYLLFNERLGGFYPPGKLEVEAGRKLTQLLPHEFWKLVDDGLLKRIGSFTRS